MKIKHRIKKPKGNNAAIVVIAALTIGSIAWLQSVASNAEDTIDVARVSSTIYRNSIVKESQLERYPMIIGEYNKYITDEGKKRVVLWEDIGKVLGTFASYPIMEGQNLEYRSLIKTRVSNEDSVMYNYPGKDIVLLEVGGGELETFKTYLQPGDTVDVYCIYKEEVARGEGAFADTEEITMTSRPYKGLEVVDLINSSGESVLDIMVYYNSLPVKTQVSLDSSSSFKAKVTPEAMVVALDNNEIEEYYKLLSKNDYEFKISLNQREIK